MLQTSFTGNGVLIWRAWRSGTCFTHAKVYASTLATELPSRLHELKLRLRLQGLASHGIKVENWLFSRCSYKILFALKSAICLWKSEKSTLSQTVLGVYLSVSKPPEHTHLTPEYHDGLGMQCISFDTDLNNNLAKHKLFQMPFRWLCQQSKWCCWYCKAFLEELYSSGLIVSGWVGHSECNPHALRIL